MPQTVYLNCFTVEENKLIKGTRNSLPSFPVNDSVTALNSRNRFSQSVTNISTEGPCGYNLNPSFFLPHQFKPLFTNSLCPQIATFILVDF